jgi:hypothetical protein
MLAAAAAGMKRLGLDERALVERREGETVRVGTY